MAKLDWNISGSGGLAVVDDAGSKRLQLNGPKLVLWNGRNNLLNAEIVGETKLYTLSTNQSAGFVLRSDTTANNAYYFCITTGNYTRRYYIFRTVSGVSTLILDVYSTQVANFYLKTRFRVDGTQLSIEEYLSGNWVLVSIVDDTFITAAGYAGLKSTGPTGYWLQYDNIEIGEKV